MSCEKSTKEALHLHLDLHLDLNGDGDGDLTPIQSPEKSSVSSTSSNSPPIRKPNTLAASANGELRPLRLTKQRDRVSTMSTSSSSGSSQTSTAFSSSISPPNGKSTNAAAAAAAAASAAAAATTCVSNPEDGFRCRPMRLGSHRNASADEIGRKKSESLGLSTSANSLQRKGSISIKNLPISHSAKRHNSLSSAALLSQQQQQHHHSPSNSDGSKFNEKYDDMIFAICLVDFHHQRGPEIQYWKSNYHPEYTPNLFRNIPFQALPDGAHLFEETFSNFNLVYDFDQGRSIDDFDALNEFTGDPRHLKTLFGCSCVRQAKTSEMSLEERERNKDITRSIVQKAVVVIVRKQPIFTKIKEKLSIITQSYFQQDNFSNFEILNHLFDNLNNQYKLLDNQMHIDLEQEEENYINLNLRSSIMKFQSSFMIIFKSLFLEKKILIYSNNNLETLTLFQNNLISLIPNLINNLDDSGCPLIDYVETNGPLFKPQSLNTTSRLSMLRFFGLPLQIFNTKNSFWNPYLPLQQLNEMKVGSFMIGCSNLLFVNQATLFGVDVLINLDTNEVTYPKTLTAPEELTLSSNDRKFINHLTNLAQQDHSHKSDDFVGSDDYIRYQFEDYLNSLISVQRYHQYAQRFQQPPPGFSKNQDNSIGQINDFNKHFIESWKKTQNYKIWNAMADEFIFNFIDPKHIGHSISNEPFSLNKNIANFFNSFSFGNSNTNGTSQDEIKAHKYLDDDNASKKSKKENNEDFVDELVAGFEKVSPSSNQGGQSHDNSSVISNEHRESKQQQNYGWAASWGLARK
ncbi:hypothetical protein KGF56_000668 [Candida oxycetoniae]|uniref:UDENN domain-containing protein n=1 Tax=Candida oxycetoniae TaxID=497107 RepID=A0AAI9WZL5_9ASCO|nr:uncharacterized protein KGF56_000668 [Candida oxycetoniae]KAI3406536.2 hypothetical protein KGF56_000668 [Candida oxycetoniae]